MSTRDAQSTSTIYYDCNNTEQDDDNDTEDNNIRPNEPLLSSLYKKNVKVGPFSIKYDDPSIPKAKPMRLYNGEEDDEIDGGSKEKQYHDFTVRSSIFDKEDDYDGEDNEDFLHNTTRYRRYFPIIIQSLLTKCLPLRILLLSLYLATTLSTFWILDSIKEPTLAILVNGELGKHQPRAKILSFVVVVILAVGMEYMDRLKLKKRRRGQQQVSSKRSGDNIQDGAEEDQTENASNTNTNDDVNAAIEQSWADRNLPLSMQNNNNESSRWKKMKTRTSYFWKRRHLFHHFTSNNSEDDQDDSSENKNGSSSTKITTLAFYIVGSLYIHFFVTVALALKTHPSFKRGTNNNDTAAASVEEEDEQHNDWYYPTLGYCLFALIESYGSVSITIFWAFANSHLTLEAAERHYGSIVALAQAGAIGGSTLSAVLGRQQRVGEVDIDNVISDVEGRVGDIDITNVKIEESTGGAQATPLLIFLACACIGTGMAIMGLYAQLFSKPMQPTAGATSVGLVSSSAADDITGEEGDDDIDKRIDYVEDDGLPVPIVQSQQLEKGGAIITASSSNSNDSIFKDLFGGVHMIFRHEYLKLVLAVSVLYEIALTCMHYEMNLIGLDRFGVGISIVDESASDNNNEEGANVKNELDEGEGITYIQFMGWYGQTVNILSLFLSFYAFPRLIKNYGLSTTIRIFPTVLLLVTIFAFVLFPENLWFLFVSLSLCKALTYSIHDPSEEVLYMPTSDDAKFRAKFWIDVVGQRIAKAIGSGINNYAGSIERIVKYGSLPSVVASLALWLACYQVGHLFDKLIKSGEIVAVSEGGEGKGPWRSEEVGLELCDEDENEDDTIATPSSSDDTRSSKIEMALL